MNTARLPVLIVGAGPAGLTLAICLTRQGLPCRILDRALQPPDDRSRAVLVQSRTLEVFDDLGVINDALAAGQLVASANLFHPSGKRGTVTFNARGNLDSPYNEPLTLPQDHTERILVARLASLGVEVERGVELVSAVDSADGPDVILRHDGGASEQVAARWVVGCDGAHSTVRQAAGLSFDGITYSDECMLGDAEIEWAIPEGEVSLCPRAEGFMLVFPLPGPRHFRIIMIMPRQASSEERRLELDEFRSQLERMTPSGLGAAGGPPIIRSAHWLTRYRLHRRGVSAYRSGNMFVAGDAAHIHSPVGAQGMNTGIQDAYNLGWKLGLVCRDEAPASLLDSYDDERRHIGELLLKGTDRMFGVVAGHGTMSRYLRRFAPTLVSRLLGAPVIGAKLAWFVSELGVKYRRSALSVDGPGAATLGGRAPHAGDRAPDAPVQRVDGTVANLFDIFRGPHHSLLLFVTDGTAAMWADDVSQRVAAEFGGLVHVAVLRAPTARAEDKYGAERGAVYLVRPDGYVGFRGAVTDVPALYAYLAQHFIQVAVTPL